MKQDISVSFKDLQSVLRFGVASVYVESPLRTGVGARETLLFDVNTLTGQSRNALKFGVRGLGPAYGMSFPSG